MGECPSSLVMSCNLIYGGANPSSPSILFDFFLKFLYNIYRKVKKDLWDSSSLVERRFSKSCHIDDTSKACRRCVKTEISHLRWKL